MGHFDDTRERIEGMTFSRSARYGCRDCRDTGFVEVMHPAMVQAIASDPDTTFEKYCATICVTCDKTRQHAGEYVNESQKGKKIPAFGSQPWHFAKHDARARLNAAAYEHKPDNYNPEFEAYA